MDLARYVFRTIHVRGDLEFRRRADGAVEIWRDALESERLPSYDGPQTRRVAIIPANEWASIVSSLTTEGETGLTFGMMMTLHNGGTAHDPDAAKHDADPEPEWMKRRPKPNASSTTALPQIFRTPRCTVAAEKTNNAYMCTREAGHDGPCAAAPNGIPCE